MITRQEIESTGFVLVEDDFYYTKRKTKLVSIYEMHGLSDWHGYPEGDANVIFEEEDGSFVYCFVGNGAYTNLYVTLKSLEHLKLIISIFK